MKSIVIIGGVAGGASAATRARRIDEHAQITIIERGNYVSYANCGLPYYVGGEIAQSQNLLLETPESFRERFNIGVDVNTNVTHIHTESQQVEAISPEGPRFYPYDSLILAPGALPFTPPIPGINRKNVQSLRTVPDALALRQYLDNNHVKNAVVVGAGFIGVEIAEMLMHRQVEVTLIDRAPQILPPFDPDFAQALATRIQESGLHLILNQTVLAIEGSDRETGVRVSSGQLLRADLVIMALGVKPDVTLAQKAGLHLGPTGAIQVNARMQTSVPTIYAAGDAVEKVNLVTGLPDWWPLAGIANKEGRVAGTNAAGGQDAFTGGLGTAIVRYTPWTMGLTGLTEKSAQRLNIPYEIGYTLRGDHASYYPGASDILTKVLYDPHTGRLLGAQVMGEGGVDKRIDVFATALYGRMSIQDLSKLDLAYAPPFGSAKDIPNIAGMAAENHLTHKIPHISARHLKGWLLKESSEQPLVLDVRDVKEVQAGRIEAALFRSIPLNALRQNLHDLKAYQSHPLVIYCRSGHRSYLAARILMQRGFHSVYNLVGGFTAWSLHSGKAS